MAVLRHEPGRPRKPWRVDWVENRIHRTRRFASKRERAIFVGDLERGERAAHRERITLSDWMVSWLTTHGLAWEPRTRRDRTDYGDRWILPWLGAMRLSEIGRAQVRDWRSQIVRKGATPYVANRSVSVLSAALGAAVDDDLIRANPCRGLKPLPVPVHRRRPATLAEVERLRAAMPTARDRAMVSLMAYAGLRPSEVRSLRWDDVRTRSVVVMSAAGEGGEKGTKTGSVRAVPIIAPLAEDLAVLERDGQLVTGDPVEHHNWATRIWRPARARAKADVPPYALRHTFASLLIAEGRNPWQVAALMGHANPQMVISTYGHLFAEAELAPPQPMEDAALAARHEVSISRSASAIAPVR